MRKIAGAVRRAINEYNMIENGDGIAVGLSGGKDSLVLLAVLASMKKYLSQEFTLKAITVGMGFENCRYDEIAAYCDMLGVEYIQCGTSIAKILFDVRKEKNPCSLCSKLIKGALNKTALENGCAKVALGHHFDDAVETFFLALFYEARLHCFSPVTYLDRKGITLIRPMIYVEEKEISRFAEKASLPVIHNPCPADGNTKREYIKRLLADLQQNDAGIKQKIFHAMREKLLNPRGFEK